MSKTNSLSYICSFVLSYESSSNFHSKFSETQIKCVTIPCFIKYFIMEFSSYVFWPPTFTRENPKFASKLSQEFASFEVLIVCLRLYTNRTFLGKWAHISMLFCNIMVKVLSTCFQWGWRSCIFSIRVTPGSWVKCRLQKRRHDQSRNFGLWPRNISWWVFGRISTVILNTIKLTTMSFSQMFTL